MKKAAVAFAVGALALAGFAASSLSSAAAHGTASTATVCPHSPVRWAIEPYDTGAALEKAYGSITKDLQAKLGCPVQLIVSNSYVAEIEAMKAGNLEMGEFGPLGYVLAHQIADAQPLAVFGEPMASPTCTTPASGCRRARRSRASRNSRARRSRSTARRQPRAASTRSPR